MRGSELCATKSATIAFPLFTSNFMMQFWERLSLKTKLRMVSEAMHALSSVKRLRGEGLSTDALGDD